MCSFAFLLAELPSLTLVSFHSSFRLNRTRRNSSPFINSLPSSAFNSKFVFPFLLTLYLSSFSLSTPSRNLLSRTDRRFLLIFPSNLSAIRTLFHLLPIHQDRHSHPFPFQDRPHSLHNSSGSSSTRWWGRVGRWRTGRGDGLGLVCGREASGAIEYRSL